jgi:hypothetical protein
MTSRMVPTAILGIMIGAIVTIGRHSLIFSTGHHRDHRLPFMRAPIGSRMQPTLAENIPQTRIVPAQIEPTSEVITTLINSTDADEETLALIVLALRKSFDFENALHGAINGR